MNKKAKRKPENERGITIRDCKFVGVEYDKPTVEILGVIANALQTNANALNNLSKVFTGSGIQIGCIMKIGEDETND